MKVLVGCPVRERAWVAPAWFDHVEVAAAEARVDLEYVFVADPDDETVPVLEAAARTYNRAIRWCWSTDVGHPATGHLDRDWHPARYQRMAELRNLLLAGVREMRPDLFLSLDSDVLLAPKVLDNLVKLASDGNWQVVGAKCHMGTDGYHRPSYALLIGSNGGFLRPESSQIIPVDVVMAIVMMTPEAWDVEYRPHPYGEDFGWALACRERALHVGWDGRVTSKHVMARHLLTRVDERCGY